LAKNFAGEFFEKKFCGKNWEKKSAALEKFLRENCGKKILKKSGRVAR